MCPAVAGTERVSIQQQTSVELLGKEAGVRTTHTVSEVKRVSSQRHTWIGTWVQTWVCLLILAEGLLSLQGEKIDPREPETVSQTP